MHSQRGRPKFARQTEATLQTLDIREFSLRRILLMRDRRSLSPLLPWAALNLLGSSMGCHAERESARSCSCRRRLHEAVVCYDERMARHECAAGRQRAGSGRGRSLRTRWRTLRRRWSPRSRWRPGPSAWSRRRGRICESHHKFMEDPSESPRAGGARSGVEQPSGGERRSSERPATRRLVATVGALPEPSDGRSGAGRLSGAAARSRHAHQRGWQRLFGARGAARLRVVLGSTARRSRTRGQARPRRRQRAARSRRWQMCWSSYI